MPACADEYMLLVNIITCTLQRGDADSNSAGNAVVSAGKRSSGHHRHTKRSSNSSNSSGSRSSASSGAADCEHLPGEGDDRYSKSNRRSSNASGVTAAARRGSQQQQQSNSGSR
jgi:hypothetical protein